MNNTRYAYSPYCDMWDRAAKTIKKGKKDDGLKDLATNLFPNVIHGKNNNKKTAEIIQGQWETIVDAAFKTANGDCGRVDFLRNKGSAGEFYVITEASEIGPQLKRSMAFSVYAAENDELTGGITVSNIFVLMINKDYVRNGDVKAIDFFNIVDVSNEIRAMAINVEAEIRKVPKIHACTEISEACSKCPYFKDICKNEFHNDVLDLMRTPLSKKALLIGKGCRTYSDVLPYLTKDTTAWRQATAHISGGEYTIFEPEKLKEWLNSLRYPLYFLDFETVQEIIPEYDGVKPFDQIPFQFSLHIQEKPGGELKHIEFLADPTKDFREDLVLKLISSIGSYGSIIAYNASFEKSRIRKMAEEHSTNEVFLNSMADRFVDLMDPFSKVWVYYIGQNGSFSVKYVLPSMFPNDPELDYHELSQVHNGTEAMDIFRKMKDMPAGEYAEARKNMLKYCGLDTYAMVKILEKLREVTSKFV